MSDLTRDMVVDRHRLLAREDFPLPRWHVDCGGTGHEIEAEVRDCRTCGPVCYPYETSETATAYVAASALLNDDFDTAGTPAGFCSSCEHAPCVAEFRRFSQDSRCWESPRALSVSRVSWPIHEAGHCLRDEPADVYRAMEGAIHQLNAFAIHGPSAGMREQALLMLVKVRDDMRRVVAS